jgi:hypothetical protein
MKLLYGLVVAMFLLLILSMSSDSKHTVFIALSFVGSFLLVLVSLAKDRLLDSDIFRKGARAAQNYIKTKNVLLHR